MKRNTHERSTLGSRVRLGLRGLLLLAVTLSACGPTATPQATPAETPVPTLPPTAEVTDTPVPDCRDFDGEFLDRHPRDELFVADQVVLIGPSEAVNQVLAQVTSDLGLTTDLVSGFELVGGEDESLLLYPEWSGSTLSVTLQAFSDGVSVERFVCLLDSAGAEFAVAADPNYLMSTGEWSIEASPWGPEETAKMGVLGGGFEEAQPDQFQSQWAFADQGLNLLDGAARLVDQSGAGVRVGVFDTSPFELAGASEDTVTIDWIDPQMDLHVIHPSLAGGYAVPAGVGKGVRNHGLFVAGLVHMLAPDSSVHLYRVLKNDGRGSLFDVSQALHDFTAGVVLDRQSAATGSPAAVANLSLGAHQPKAMVDHGMKPQIASLQAILAEAVGAGIVVVASAGNDSAPEVPLDTSCDGTPVHCMEIPATLEPVVGVAASNYSGGRSCFSNRGDVAAPGGDGSGSECAFPPPCTSEPELCLVSLSNDAQSKFVYWAGTSFATPLVSGLAALLLESGVAPADVPAEIYGAAAATDPNLGAGIATLP